MITKELDNPRKLSILNGCSFCNLLLLMGIELMSVEYIVIVDRTYTIF